MVTAENTMSAGGQHALQDMVEMEMYLVAQSQQTPWPMLPRGARKLHDTRKPHSSVVEASAAKELIDQGFLEATSSRTFVVSRSGHRFYEREMKPHSA
jgi:uncharacterized protein with von Willebrand factor type A (vWA) domain